MAETNFFLRQKPEKAFLTVTFGPGDLWYLRYFDLSRENASQIQHEKNKIVQSSKAPFRILSLGSAFVVSLEQRPENRINAYYLGGFDPSCFVSSIRFKNLDVIRNICSTFETALEEFRRSYFPCIDYYRFANILRLNALHINEFRESWCREASESLAGMMSYIGFDGFHIAKDEKGKNACVFGKTDFFIERHEQLQQFKGTQSIRESSFQTYVYIMEDLRNKRIKLGKSKNPMNREKTLQSEVPQIILRFAIPCEETTERILHEEFSDYRVRGEWCSLDEKDCLMIVQRLIRSGDSQRVLIPDHSWLGGVYRTCIDAKSNSKSNDCRIEVNNEASELILRGKELFKARDYSGSLIAYTKAIEIDPTSAIAFSCRGNSKAGLGELQSALCDHDIAVRLSPTNPTVFVNRGCTRLKMEQFLASIEDFDEAEKLNGTGGFVYEHRGIAKAGLNDLKGAIHDYDKSIEKDSGRPGAYNCRGWAQLLLGNIHSALKDFDEALLLAPDYATALSNKAFVLAVVIADDFKKYGDPLELSAQALKSAPANPYAMNAMSCAHAFHGDFRTAIECQRLAMRDCKWMEDKNIDGGSLANARIATWERQNRWTPTIK